MEGLDLLGDFYCGLDYLGPGGAEQTALALALAGLDETSPLQVADIGCGTGASALALASRLNATVTAVDFLPQFLQRLASKARAQGLEDRIRTLDCDMSRLPFRADSLDMIWSEGAIYNLGFRRGVREWREFLSPGGVLAVSEITWLTPARPAPLERFWNSAYPEIDTAPAKLQVLQEAGFTPLGYFVLPETCWMDNYYEPMAAGFDAFLSRHQDSPGAQALVEEQRREIDLYRRYSEYYSYGFYVARRCDPERVA